MTRACAFVCFQPHARRRYVLKTLRDIKLPDLDEALLVLPFTTAVTLLRYCDGFLRDGMAAVLASHVVVFLVRIHFSQLVSTGSTRRLLHSLRDFTHGQLQALQVCCRYYVSCG